MLINNDEYFGILALTAVTMHIVFDEIENNLDEIFSLPAPLISIEP